MKLYRCDATVNYPETTEIDTPTYSGLTQEGAWEFVRRLLKTEQDATSFVITIVAEKE